MRYITCPCCGEKTRLPVAWMLGVEVVFACGSCNCKLKTGYKMGALFSALGLVGALVTANLGVWLFSAFTLPFFVAIVIPLWLLYGSLLRRWRLLRKYAKKARKTD
ncbi:MAG: hypothetical protein LBU95_03610 [Rikenellaceae bacterium]|nr:hypothetical protein [Rikenellaceae bacterium]